MAAKDIRVGIRSDSSPTPAALGAYWVAIGDTVLDATEDAVMSIDHHADNGFHHVTITLACRSYATVDVRERPEPSEIVLDEDALDRPEPSEIVLDEDALDRR